MFSFASGKSEIFFCPKAGKKRGDLEIQNHCAYLTQAYPLASSSWTRVLARAS